MQNLVSVVIPSYQHSMYIEQCLESIISQTYNDIEIILIDDCSKDDTFHIAHDILNKYSNRFRKCTVLKNIRNYGAPYTINKCLSFASGRYVAFCNSDDTFHPKRLSQMVDALAGRDIGLAFSDVSVVNYDGHGYLRDKLAAQIQFNSQHASLNFPTISWAFLDGQIATSTGNLIITRNLIKYLFGFKDYKYCHDWDFFLRSIIYTEPVYVNQSLYNYRIHKSNSFSELSHVAVDESFECLSNYFKYVQNNNPINKLAPCRANWPDTFEYYLERCSGNWVYQRHYDLYKQHHRTIDDIYNFDRNKCMEILTKGKQIKLEKI